DRGAVEQISVCCLIVIKWFCPELVSQTEQFLLAVIPQGKCEHAMHVVRHLISPSLIRADQYFLLAFFPRKVKRDLQPLAEFFPVADMSSVFFYCYHM